MCQVQHKAHHKALIWDDKQWRGKLETSELVSDQSIYVYKWKSSLLTSGEAMLIQQHSSRLYKEHKVPGGDQHVHPDCEPEEIIKRAQWCLHLV